MENEKSIIVKKLNKNFKIGFKKNQSALRKLAGFFSGREPKRTMKVLDDVSFEVNKGEILGVIGKNGSGKSTLLRVLAGIYRKDFGLIKIRGKVISLIGLNVGLKDRLTMRENIYLCCSLFGLSALETEKKFSSIVSFAGLENYVGTKLYQFSSGMGQRLAFSIAIHCNPSILLLDEVFEVGDEEFRRKSVDKIQEMVKRGASVVLVSHNLEMIRKYCDRVLWLDKGKRFEIGDTSSLLDKYLKPF